MTILDLLSEDIRGLSDETLAELLGQLIVAEAANNGIPLSTITHGGHDNAADEGVDARVSWLGDPERTDFLPRRVTVFQSKAESMSRKPLTDEMAPGGEPRVLFQELAKLDGAYVMFCGSDNCNDRMLRDRKDAMRSALSTVSQADRLELDFYDASRIARWVNMHAGVAAWLRDRLGRPLWGWRSYAPWSRSDSSEELPYLSDETPRAAFTFDDQAPQVSALDALNRVRSELAQAGRSVRLVGLSGTGKTRFAEALFDETVGLGALPKPHVIYGDVASAEVSPTRIAEQLSAGRRRAIMIADNCPAPAHRQVTQIITRPNSQISFLSIDYDVGEDQPEATLVVFFGADSDDIIAALLAQRAPGLEATDRDRITEFSGGNSRIALALLRSAQEGESLTNLTDRELVRRLFQDDRYPASDTLIWCAEIASLVIQYSVEAAEEEEQPEYHHLANLAGVSPGEMFRATGTFLDRGVAQQRGRWRAILPHALATRLARQALRRISRGQLYEAFAERASRRLALSFARRLGQIDNQTEAQALAKILLAKGGPVDVISESDRWGLSMLQALAPAAQDTALDVIERSLSLDDTRVLTKDKSESRYWIANLLMHLAYKPEMFSRAARLLAQVVQEEDRNNNTNNVRHLFEQLFWIIMSGTLAEPIQRSSIIDEMLASVDTMRRQLAVDALDAMLKTSRFTSSTDLTKFGGQTRSWGWRPQSNQQTEEQFASATKRLTALAISEDPLAERARSVLAGSMRALTDERFIHIAEQVANALRALGFWASGWREICMRLHFDRRDGSHELLRRVERLERFLAPTELNERFEAFVLHPSWQLYTPRPKNENDHHIDVRVEIERISIELRDQPERLCELIRSATCPGQGEAALFGELLVAAGLEIDDLYGIGIEAWEAANSEARQLGFLFGVLRGVAKHDTERAEEMLDQIERHESLAAELVQLSRAVVPLTPRSLNRIHCSLRAGRVRPASLASLAGAASNQQLPQAELTMLLKDLLERGQEGEAAAARIIFHLQQHEIGEANGLNPELCTLARQLVESEHFFSSRDDISTHRAMVIAKKVLAREDDPTLASRIIRNVRVAIEGGRWGDVSLKNVLSCVAHRHPEVFLSEVVLDRRAEDVRWYYFTGDDESGPETSQNPIDKVDRNVLVEWVKADPKHRARLAAQTVTYIASNGESDGDVVWSSTALQLIGIEESALDVLDEFESRFSFGGWWGSDANRYARGRPLCEALLDHGNPNVRIWARDALRRIDDAIQRAEQSERRENQSFE